MFSPEFFGITASVLATCAFIPYFYSIFKGETHPHLYSWIIWSLIQGTGAWIMLAEGAAWGAAALLITAFFCVCVCLLCFWYRTRTITRLDTACLVGALAAFALYAIVKEPYMSLSLAIFIDLVGFIPTFRKAIEEHESEVVTTWALFAISNVFSLAALHEITFLTAAYLIVLLICETFLAGTLLVIKMRKKSSV